MGQELKIRHCVLKIKVNTNLIVRNVVPTKHISFYNLNFTTTAVPVIQSPSSKSSPFKSKSKSKSSPFKSSPSPQEIGLESDLSPIKSRTRVLQLWSAVFAVARCLSVRLTRWCVVSARLKISSNFLFGLVAPSLYSLFDPCAGTKFRR